MPKILENEALALAQGIDSLPPEQQVQAADVLRRYREQQHDLGEPEWPSYEQAAQESEGRFRALFDDLKNVDNQSPSFTQGLRFSTDPDADRARVAGTAFLSRVYGKQPEEVSRMFPLLRDDYLNKRGQKTGADDRAFYAFAQGEVKRMTAREKAALEGAKAALRGEDSGKALAAWQAANPDTAKEDSGFFSTGYNKASEEDGDSLPVAANLLSLLESGSFKSKDGKAVSTPFTDEQAAQLGGMVEQLAGMKPRQRKSIYRAMNARIEAAGYDQKGFWAQMLSELDRGLYRASTTLGTQAGVLGDVMEAQANASQRSVDFSMDGGGGFSTPVLSTEEQQQLQRQRDYREQVGNVQAELQDIVAGRLDPVKPTVSWLNDTIETGLIKGPGAVAPFMAASAALGPWGAGVLFTADFAEQNRRDLVGMGMDADQARQIGALAAPAQAAVESLSNLFQLGRFPAVSAALARFTKPVGGGSLVGRYVQNSLLAGVTEFAEEQIQDNFIVPAAQELLGALESDLPDVDWSFYKERAIQATPELAATLLPMALVFGGVMTAADAKLSQQMTGNIDALTALNFSQAQATEIVSQKTTEERIAKAASLWRSRAGNKASLEEGAKNLSAKLRELSADTLKHQQELERRGILPRMLHAQDDSWILTYNDGSTASFATHGEASTARWNWAEDQLGRTHALTREALTSMERNMSAGRELAVEFKPDARTAQDVVNEGVGMDQVLRRVEQGKALGDVPVEESFDNASAFDQATQDAEGFLSSLQILGSSRNEFKDGILRTTIRLWEGSNVLTLVEEKLEGDAKAILQSSTGRAWMLGVLRNYEQESGDKLFRDVADTSITNDDLAEAWSHLGQSYLVGRSSFGDPLQQNNMRRFSKLLMRAGLAGAINAESTFWQAVVNRAQKLGELKKSGKLGDDLAAELERQLGIDSQVVHEQGAMQEAQQVAQDVAEQVDTSGYSEANPGPNGETFSLSVQARGGVPFKAGDRVASVAFEATVYSVERSMNGTGYWVVYTDVSRGPQWVGGERIKLAPFAKPFDADTEPVRVLKRGNASAIFSGNAELEALKEQQIRPETKTGSLPISQSLYENDEYKAPDLFGPKAGAIKKGDWLDFDGPRQVTGVEKLFGGDVWITFGSFAARFSQDSRLKRARAIPVDASKVVQMPDGQPVANETFSLSVTPAQDAEYMAAVEAGDLAKAQRMVDEAAANAGYGIEMWHATKNTDFTAFKKGSWFAFDWRDSQPFGSPKRFYLNPQNAVNNAKSAPANGEFAERGPREDRFFKVQKGEPDGVLKFQQGMHFDAVMQIYDPSIVKSSDPVTYDDAGNVIPLSQRFNPADDRITYSLRSGDFASRVEAMFSPFQRSPEARLVMARVAKDRALRLGNELIDKANIIRTMGSIDREARVRAALAEDEAVQGYLDSLTPAARQTLEWEPSDLKDDPLVSAMLDYGKLMSKSTAVRSGKLSEKAGEYDGIPWLPPSFYSKGMGIMPDQMAQAMYDAGLLSEPRTDTLWDELSKRVESTRKNKEAYRAAVQQLEDVKKQAVESVKPWADNAKKQAGSAKAQRDRIKAWLRVLDGILAAAPPEVRARVGGYVKMAGIATDEAALRYLEDRVGKLDRELDKWLKKEGTKSLEKLFKKAAADFTAGKKAKGKIGPDEHYLLQRAEAASEMDASTLVGELAKLDALANDDNLTAEQQAMAELERGIFELVGNIREADAGRIFSAFDALTAIYQRGVMEWKTKQIARREQREAVRSELKADTGKTGTGKERRETEERMATAFGKLKSAWLSVSSFSEVLDFAFGRKSIQKIALVDAERESSNTYEDEQQAIADELEGLFTTMAGTGKVLDGEKLRFQMSQRSIEAGDLKLSQFEAISALLMWRQEDGKRHMEGTLDESGKRTSAWGYDQAWVDEVEKQLTPEARRVMAWLSGKYSAEHAELNPLYRERHGVNLPQHDNYAPLLVKPMQAKAGEMVDPVSGAAVSGSILTPGSLRTRSRNAIAEPDFRDALQVFMAHKKQMGYWKAYYDLAVEAQAVLGNRELMNSVEAKAGKEAVSVIRKWLDVFAQGGVRDAAAGLALMEGLRAMSGRAATVGLLGRVTTLLVQSTQLAAASVQMPVGAYLKRFGKLLAGQLDWSGAIKSDFIQRRIKSAPPIVRQAMEGLGTAKNPNQIKRAVRGLGNLLSGADGLFTGGTYAILLDYHREQGAKLGLKGDELEEYAHTEAERTTEEVAQPTRSATRSLAELTSTNPLAKVGWAYASEARQKIALFGWALESGDKTRAAKVAFLVFGVGGVLSQVLKNLWKEARGDDDEKMWSADRLVKSAFSPITSGIPGFSLLFGEGNMFQGVQWAPTAAKDLATGKGDLRDVNTVLATLGLFNDTAAGVAALSNAGLDFAKLVENLFSGE